MIDIAKKIIKNCFNSTGYVVKSTQKLLICNYFSTTHTKNALITYIVHPFQFPTGYNHTNGFESLEIARILNELGFNVDVTSYLNYSRDIDYGKYDLIFGFGEAFENSFFISKPMLRIYYGTGCRPDFQNLQTIFRLKKFYLKHNRFTRNLQE